MKRKKVLSPKELKLLDGIHADTSTFDRWYGRMKRAVKAMEKARRRAMAKQRSLQKLREEPPQTA